MQFYIEIVVRFHSLPVEEPKALRKVQINEAIIPMQIINCLHLSAGIPVKAKSIFNKMPEIEQKPANEDWKNAYNKQELIDSLNPKNKLIVYDMKPAYKWTLDQAGVKEYKRRKIYFNGKKLQRIPGGAERWNYQKPVYKKYIKPLEKWDDRKEILSQFLIPDISNIVLNLAFDAPKYEELDKHKYVDMKMGEEWQIGDIISKIENHNRDRVVCRVVGMSKSRYIYAEELYFDEVYIGNGISQKIYDPKKIHENARKVNFRKKQCHSFLDYDGKFKVENGEQILMLN